MAKYRELEYGGREEIALICGIDRRSMNRLMNNHETVYLATVDKIAIALGFHPANIYPEEYRSEKKRH